ncbi:MAG: hypothetical protein IJL91_06840 [Bacteroidales bacterium]|nr:hypothetical protein [Bacteroidales bacterium]
MNHEVKTNMTMTYELITPEYAKELLGTSVGNRTISKGTRAVYGQDMLNGNWTEETGNSISIDWNGHLRDGHHRLEEIVEIGVSVKMWVCRNVDPNGVVDCNRVRSMSDQIKIGMPNVEGIYSSNGFISVAKAIVTNSEGRRRMSQGELKDFIAKHKEDLDGFFLKLPQRRIGRISIAAVITAMFSAYMGGNKTR